MTGRCPECDFEIDIDDPEVGEILDCPECGVELEVIGIKPLEFSIISDDELLDEDEWDEDFDEELGDEDDEELDEKEDDEDDDDGLEEDEDETVDDDIDEEDLD